MTVRSLPSAALSALLAVLLLPVLVATGPGAAAAAAKRPAVGPGSYLAVVDHGPPSEYGGIDARSQRLVLVAPDGDTRTLYRRKVSRRLGGFVLLDWSADGRTALLTATGRRGPLAIRVDVPSGAVHQQRVRRLETAMLDPDGSGILASRWKSRRSNMLVLDRIGWDGERTRLRRGITGTLTPGPDGTVVVSDRRRGKVQLTLSTQDGTVLHRWRSRGYCTPVRWWDDHRLLQTCGQDLRLVDAAAGRATWLTRRHAQGDYGHLDARYDGGRLYVQAAGGCGYAFVVRRTRAGAMRHLQVPGAVGSVVLVDAVGKELVIQHAASCDGETPRSVLSRFDPVHHAETPLVELGRRQGFGRVLVFGESRASVY